MNILFYKKVFNRNFSIYDRLGIGEIPTLLPSGIKVSFSSHPVDLNTADVVIWDIPFLRNEYEKRPKPTGQLWVGWLLESMEVYNWIPEVLHLFDYTMTYSINSDIPIPFFCYNFINELRSKPINKSGKICSFISSKVNQSRRREYLNELLELTQVDCFGYRKNTSIPDRNYKTKLHFQKRYYFSLAFENSICHDFVTEKFWDSLLTGSVPVYLGADNIDQFAPGENCYINARDYTAKELAGYLEDLSHDSVAYGRMIEWKNKPFRPEFINLLSLVEKPFILRLLDKLAEL